MTNEPRKRELIARLQTMSKSEIRNFIAFMRLLREMPEAESRQLAAALAKKSTK